MKFVATHCFHRLSRLSRFNYNRTGMAVDKKSVLPIKTIAFLSVWYSVRWCNACINDEYRLEREWQLFIIKITITTDLSIRFDSIAWMWDCHSNASSLPPSPLSLFVALRRCSACLVVIQTSEWVAVRVCASENILSSPEYHCIGQRY